MSQLQPAALRYVANEFACLADDPMHKDRMRILVRDALEGAANELERLASGDLDPAGLARAREAYIRELVQRPDQDVGTMVAAIVRAYRAGSAGNV